PATPTVVQVLATDKAITKVVAAFGRHLVDRQHVLVDRPGVRDLRVEPRLRSARKIGMLSEAAGHRLRRDIAAGQAQGKDAPVESKLLTRLIIPRPLTRRMTEAQRRFRSAGILHLPP